MSIRSKCYREYENEIGQFGNPFFNIQKKAIPIEKECLVCNLPFHTFFDIEVCSDKCYKIKLHKKIYQKNCGMCNKKFNTTYKNKNICSLLCRQQKITTYTRDLMRKHREAKRNRIKIPCQVCGFNETTDLHHENGEAYILCPNHHALLSRGIIQLSEYHISPVQL